LNKLSGIIGVFNCQRAGKWPPVPGSQYLRPPGSAPSLECHVSPQDVEFLEEVAGESWNGTCAVYAFNSGSNPISCNMPPLFLYTLLFCSSLTQSSLSSCRIALYNAKERKFWSLLGTS